MFSLIKIGVLKHKPGKGTGAAINNFPDSCNPLVLSGQLNPTLSGMFAFVVACAVCNRWQIVRLLAVK